MNTLSQWRSRPRTVLILLMLLVAGHAILFHLLWRAGMSRAGISGVVVSAMIVLVVAKHLGLLAPLLHRFFRRRPKPGKSES